MKTKRDYSKYILQDSSDPPLWPQSAQPKEQLTSYIKWSRTPLCGPLCIHCREICRLWNITIITTAEERKNSYLGRTSRYLRTFGVLSYLLCCGTSSSNQKPITKPNSRARPPSFFTGCIVQGGRSQTAARRLPGDRTAIAPAWTRRRTLIAPYRSKGLLIDTRLGWAGIII